MDYQLIRSNRKTTALQVRPDGTLVVRAPLRKPEAEIRALVEQHRAWIEKNRQRAAETVPDPAQRLSPEEIRALADEALRVLPPLAAQYARRMGVTFGRITVRNQRTKWGSCSAAGNLNFNCLLMLCPRAVAEYIVVHELCHRKQMNHSKEFWAEVEAVCPDYKKRRRWLRDHGDELMHAR